MDGFKSVMLMMGVVGAVVFPVQLVRMIRRRDSGRIFGLFVSAALMVLLFSDVFWPGAIHAAVPAVRWLAVAVAVLFLANGFGFGQWLFRPKAKPEPPSA